MFNWKTRDYSERRRASTRARGTHRSRPLSFAFSPFRRAFSSIFLAAARLGATRRDADILVTRFATPANVSRQRILAAFPSVPQPFRAFRHVYDSQRQTVSPRFIIRSKELLLLVPYPRTTRSSVICLGNFLRVFSKTTARHETRW